MTTSNYERLDFIGVLRGVACLFVVYAHVVVNYAKNHKIDLDSVSFIQDYVTTPLGIIQNFGWFGVVLFFLISGYIITHTMQRESAGSFVIKRIFRIYPAFLVCVIITAVVRHYLNGKEFYDIENYLLAMTLSGIWPERQYGLLGVEWTLVIEMKFYAITLLVFWFHKHSPRAAISLQLSLVAAAIYFCRDFGNTFFLFTVSISYVPFLITGQLLYFLQRGMIGRNFFLTATVVALAVAIFGIKSYHPRYLAADNSYLVTFVYCYVIFCFAAIYSSRIQSNQFTTFFEKISYSLYLYHGLVSFAILDFLTPHIDNHWLRIGISLAAGFSVSWWSYRYVEEPAQQLSRWIIKRSSQLLSARSVSAEGDATPPSTDLKVP
jgi:peptidoglycan/LPS O-acetylase OafA/YrhL